MTDAATTAFTSLTDIAAQRHQLYRLLSEAFRDPTYEWADDVTSGRLSARVATAVAWLGADRTVFDSSLAALSAAGREAAELSTVQLLTDLKVEYARLFIGPPRAAVPMFASQHLGGETDLGGPLLGIGTNTAAVALCYRAAGFEVDPTLREPPDHIATELEFLASLCDKERSGWADDDPETGRNWRAEQNDFIVAHVAPWALDFLATVARESHHPIYAAVAAIAETFIRTESGAFRPG